MLALTRPHRQVLASLAVMLGMVVPTGFIAWSSWRLNQPEHRLTVARELSRELGLAVEIQRVSYPRPAVMVLHGLVIRSETSGSKRGTGAGPASAAGLELVRAEELRVEDSGATTTMRSDGLRVAAASPRQAMAQLVSLLQRASTRPVDTLALHAPTLELDLGEGLGYSIRDVASTFRLHENRRAEVRASYRLAEVPGNPRCELTLDREPTANGSTMRTTLALRSVDGGTVPARVLDLFCQSAGWLGSRASLEGELTLSQEGAGEWDASFHGTIHDVELASLVQQVAPEQRLSGQARLSIEQARWGEQPSKRGSGWLEARGSLAVGQGGSIGGELLRNLAGRLRFRVAERLDTSRTDVEYDELGLAFHLRPDGQIRLSGSLGPECGPDAVLVQGTRAMVLARAPEGEATVTGLIWALAPDGAMSVDRSIPAGVRSLMMQESLPTSNLAN